MTDPMNQHTGQDARRSDQQKVLELLDLLGVIVRALFRVFGRRRDDPQ